MNFPGPTKYIGKRSRSYVKQFEQDIQSEKTEQAKSKQQQTKPSASSNIGKKIAQQAGRSVGKTTLTYKSKRYRYDCSGFVEASYAAGGVPLAGASKTLFEMAKKHRLLHKKKQPQPGDIAFFDDTFDRNKNGRRDDKITHVAIVEKVDGDGLITLVHLGSRGIHRIYMNLHEEKTYRKGRKVWNSYLRARSSKKDQGPRLSGELWRSFGSLWKLSPSS